MTVYYDGDEKDTETFLIATREESGQGGLECSRAARGERPARRPAPIPAPTTPRFPPPPAPPRLLAPRAAPGLRALGGQQGGAAQGLAGPLAAPEAAECSCGIIMMIEGLHHRLAARPYASPMANDRGSAEQGRLER